MKKLDLYIFEKLHLNSNTKVQDASNLVNELFSTFGFYSTDDIDKDIIELVTSWAEENINCRTFDTIICSTNIFKIFNIKEHLQKGYRRPTKEFFNKIYWEILGYADRKNIISFKDFLFVKYKNYLLCAHGTMSSGRFTIVPTSSIIKIAKNK